MFPCLHLLCVILVDKMDEIALSSRQRAWKQSADIMLHHVTSLSDAWTEHLFTNSLGWLNASCVEVAKDFGCFEDLVNERNVHLAWAVTPHAVEDTARPVGEMGVTCMPVIDVNDEEQSSMQFWPPPPPHRATLHRTVCSQRNNDHVELLTEVSEARGPADDCEPTEHAEAEDAGKLSKRTRPSRPPHIPTLSAPEARDQAQNISQCAECFAIWRTHFWMFDWERCCCLC